MPNELIEAMLDAVMREHGPAFLDRNPPLPPAGDQRC